MGFGTEVREISKLELLIRYGYTIEKLRMKLRSLGYRDEIDINEEEEQLR